MNRLKRESASEGRERSTSTRVCSSMYWSAPAPALITECPDEVRAGRAMNATELKSERYGKQLMNLVRGCASPNEARRR